MKSNNTVKLDVNLMNQKIQNIAAVNHVDKQAPEDIPSVLSQDSNNGLGEVGSSIFPPAPASLSEPFATLTDGGANETSHRPKNSRWRRIIAPGLTPRQRLRAVPLLGYLLSLIQAVLRLPVSQLRQALQFDAFQLQIQQQQQHIALLQRQVQDLSGRVNQVEPYVAGIQYQLQHALNLSKDRISSLEQVKSDQRLHRYDVLDIGARLMRIEQTLISKQFRTALHQAQVKQELNQESASSVNVSFVEDKILSAVATDKKSPLPAFDQDEFFLAFEDHFRGSPADIQNRQRIYLPYLEEVKAKARMERTPFIDLGCGRGEWLSLLKDVNIPAIGIDLNTRKIEECVAQGLDAKHADALAFLQSQQPGTIAGVTGFHLIEHLSFEQMIALFDAAYVALQPGGLLIFETPNPENLIIGSCSFHVDPTHQKPIVPDVAQFIARQRGFSKAEILRLNPFEEDMHLQATSPTQELLNRLLFGARDFALIAWK